MVRVWRAPYDGEMTIPESTPTPAREPLTGPVTVRAERMVAGGDAMAHLVDGRVAFVTGALPGEEVETAVRNDRKDFAKLVVTEVIEASPQRVVPECPHRRAG
jgi:tRNA/tmRNA/rRNA uracil-C5-methylase (TrmA/RlmC/RlmD family)